jgi:hypothetical protein
MVVFAAAASERQVRYPAHGYVRSMRDSEPPTRPTLAYATSPAQLTHAEARWAVLPALVVLALGVALPLGIAHWLRIRYGPYSITQWTANAAQIEFWSCDVPLIGLLVVWGFAMTLSLRRCVTAAGRYLSITVGVFALFVVFLSFVVIMDAPFP